MSHNGYEQPSSSISKAILTEEQECGDLESFIGRYIPSTWKEPIRTCMFVPMVSVEDLRKIKQRILHERFAHWAVRDAINEWLRKRGL